MTYVFVYGTLKRGHGNNHLLRNSRFVQEATTLPHYRLFERGIPYLVEQLRNCGLAIKGEVWEVDDATLANLDRLEGVPHHYQRKQIDLVQDFDQPTFAYFYAGDVSRLRDCGTQWPPVKEERPVSKEAIALFRKAVDQQIALRKTFREIDDLVGPTLGLEDEVSHIASNVERGEDVNEVSIEDAFNSCKDYD